MASKKEIRSYFVVNNTGKDSHISKKPRLSNSEIVDSVTDNVCRAELEMPREEVKQRVARKETYESIPDKIRKEVGRYALINGTKASIDQYSKIYPKYTFKRTTVNTWKAKCKNNKEGPLAKNSGRPNVLSNELLKKTKDIVIGTRQASTVISRRMVIAIGTGVVKANEPNLLEEYGGHLELTEDWARHLLKSMEWVNRKN